MPAPGTTVTTRARQPAATVNEDISTGFMAGLAERGPSDRAVLVRNMDQYVDMFGDRVTNYTVLYDAADAFFREGGSRLYVSRVFGPAPTLATVNLADVTPTNTLRADAVNPGAWGADVDVVVTAGGAGNFILSVTDDGVVMETSPELADKAAAIEWASGSDFIRLVDLGAGVDPVPATYSLVGGTDDRASATDATWDASLARFTKDKGPGQVAMPGRTTGTAHVQVLVHCEANNRVAQLDLPDTASKATLIAATAALHARDDARYGAAFAPWGVIEGVAPGTTRTVPWSAIQMGMTARSDGSGNHANRAVAGENGISLSAIDLSQDEWVEADRSDLNDAGVNVVRPLAGTIRTYGYRALSDPVTDEAFIQFSASREFMSLGARGDTILERAMFGNIDGKGLFLANVNGQLGGLCLEDYDAGALYGETPEEAFVVDTGPAANPPEDLATGVVRAVLAVKVSPFAERVILEIVKVKNTEALV